MGVFFILFWISLAILFYTYAGYALLLYAYNNIRKLIKPPLPPTTTYTPAVTLVVPAFNEAVTLSTKIENSFALEYPRDKLKLLFVTDGSTDDTGEIISKFPSIIHLHQAERHGKMAAINRAMQHVQTPVVIFSDANTQLNKNAVSLIVQHYANNQIGGVAGEKKVELNQPSNVLVGEGIYWQYESKMKQLDSDFFTVVGAAGELFSMRTELFEPQKEDTIVDDFILSMNICMKGYKVIYEPLAYAIETPSVNLYEESKRRTRIAAGAFQSLFRLTSLFNFFKYPILSFQYISRRVFKWALCPVALVVIYIANLVLILSASNLFFEVAFIVQNVGYALALCGWLFKTTRQSLIVFVPFYFVFMNLSLVIGFTRYVAGKQSPLWEKSKRATS